MNKFEKKAKKVLSKDLELPDNYLNMINSNLSRFDKTHNNYKHKIISKLAIAVSCFLLILTSGVVIAKTIPIVVNHFFDNSRGKDIAIENGYLEELYDTEMKSNDINISIENILMDDFNLSFTLKINFLNDIDVSKISKVLLDNMIITDDEKRILYCEDVGTFQTYCNENNLNYNFNEFSDNYVNSGINFYIKNKSIDSSSVELIYNLYGNNYPKSKNININFNQIRIFESENNYSSLANDWNLNIELSEKFYNREAIIYTVKSCSDPNLNITNISLYNTGFKFEFETKFDEWYSDSDSQEEIDKAYEEFQEWHYDLIVNKNKKMIENEYIVNEDNVKFYPLESSSEDSYTSYLVNGDFSHLQTFGLTQYDSSLKKITIYFTINIPNFTEDVIIELERNS